MNNTNNNQIGMPPMDPSQQVQMTPEEMKADLSRLMSKVDSRYQDFNSLKIQSQNGDQAMQEETLNKVFEILAQAGIDGTNPEEMNAFLEKLKVSNPELFQLFSDAITSLMGGEVAPGQPLSNDSMMPPDQLGMSGMSGV